MARSPYPLQWPDGWPRVEAWRRGRPKFEAQFARDRDSVIRQLRMRHGSNIVITSDLPTRNDGLPYANARCTEPGVAVWWVEKGRERVMACDRWKDVSFNLRAIEMSIEALRGLDRWGASEVVERAFAGFAALPPGAPLGPAKRPWREVLGVDALCREAHSQGGPAAAIAIAKAAHRELIRKHHPDMGGSHELAAELNAALAEAERELGATP